MTAQRKGRKVTFLQMDPRNNRNLFIGYEDGMAEIIDSSNFMKSIYSTDKNDTVKYKDETKKRIDLGEVAKIVFLDDPSIHKRHDYANLIVVHGKHIQKKCLTQQCLAYVKDEENSDEEEKSAEEKAAKD